MNRVLSTITALLLICAVSNGARAQGFESEIDRSEIVRGETITLTVRVFDRQGSVPVDLSSLNGRFDVISTGSSSQLRTVNNRVEARTEYRFVLFPRNLGEQEIPPIEVGDHTTDPFTINVQDPPERTAADSDLYLETTLSADSVYVQQQLLFTIRLFYTLDGIRNPNFTDLDMDNTVVRMLGQANQYEELIDGERYGVYEMNYVIFPQRSGPLEIPDIVFRGQVTDGNSRRLFGSRNVSPITAFAEGSTVEVKERPQSFPQNATWLPSSSLTVQEEFNRDITSLEPGDSVQRRIRVTAVGLDDAALPPIPHPDIEGMNVYPEPAETQRRVVDDNVVGSRTDTFSLVATESGSVLIPEVRIPWWNVETEELEFAVLPEAFITVGGPPAQQGEAGDPRVSTGETLSLDLADEGLSSPDSLISSPRPPVWAITGIALLLALAAIAILFFYRSRATLTHRGEQAIPISPIYQRSLDTDQERDAFSELEQRCREGRPGPIRLALIAWGRQYYRDSDLHTLDSLAARTGEPEIVNACQSLQAALYGSGKGAETLSPEQSRSLLALFTRLRNRSRRQRQQQARQAPYQLPPLYRN